jgi:hypothetical protein
MGANMSPVGKSSGAEQPIELGPILSREFKYYRTTESSPLYKSRFSF